MTTDFFYQEEQKSALDLHKILGIVRRRYLHFLIPAFVIGIASVVIAMLLTPKYESSGTVLVESQQIPTELVQSTVTSDPNQRITIIKQRVMTRANLLRIIDKYGVFADKRQKLSPTKLVDEMQRLVGLQVINSDGRNRQTIAFKVSFRHKSPVVATQVANELVTLFLSENVKTRTARATETTEFLEQETQKLKAQLEKAEAAISEYKRRNNQSLPEHLNLKLAMLERTENEIRSLEQQLSSLREERRFLDIELAAASEGQTLDGSTPIKSLKSNLENELEELNNELSIASSRLTAAHPDIKALKRKIAALEQKIANEETKGTSGAGSASDALFSRLVEKLRVRISTTAQNISVYEANIAKLRTKAADIENLILKTPEVERGLINLTRTYQEVLQKYEELQTKKRTAEVAQNLETEKKAERFTLLEPPLQPTDPVWPNKMKIVAAGGVLAAAVGFGVVLLFELLDKRVRSLSELEALIKAPPLASIPYIRTPSDNRKRIVGYLMLAIVPLGILGAGVVSMHYLYKPIDLIFYRIWSVLQGLGLMNF
ncbi:GumC family protein [Sneathiella chinensis]|uniref:LPS biosynthesis protein n=1 Tax=Sneathiella chinensis TaxID=349750 RepID=A0ABQ5U9S5_9PROT|nr:Wzz/FepE/Etk N-terminal domain-containing protein [Sneathiella chinensis]GLQ07938.1 LPS biosynthesis protein [Sneathiella chinensis]